MVFNFNNMNNPWMNIAQQGLGMLFGGNCMNSMMGMNTGIFGGGFSGMPFGNMTGMGCGNSIFTNCFGQVDYDAMAGFGVANALVSVAGMAIQSHQAEKPEEKANEVTKEDIDNLQQEIRDLKKKKADTKTIEENLDSKYQDAIDSANGNIGTLNERLKTLREENKTNSNTLETLKKQEPKDETKIAELEQKMSEACKEIQTIASTDENKEGSIANENKKLREAKEAKENAIKEVQDKIQEEIEAKEKELEDLEEIRKPQVLDEADGTKLQRATKKSYEKNWTKDVNENRTIASNADFDKKDLRYALNKYIESGDARKEELGQEVLDIWKWLKDNKNPSERMGFADAVRYVENDLDKIKEEKEKRNSN